MIALRNWSVHYRPQSYSHDEPDLRAKVEDARARIAENALMAGSNNPWFPDKALGAGCARWAVLTVRAFVDEFVDAVGCAADCRDLSWYDEQPLGSAVSRPGAAAHRGHRVRPWNDGYGRGPRVAAALARALQHHHQCPRPTTAPRSGFPLTNPVV